MGILWFMIVTSKYGTVEDFYFKILKIGWNPRWQKKEEGLAVQRLTWKISVSSGYFVTHKDAIVTQW